MSKELTKLREKLRKESLEIRKLNISLFIDQDKNGDLITGNTKVSNNEVLSKYRGIDLKFDE